MDPGDSDEADDIETRVAQLERVVRKQNETIQEMLPSRRSVFTAGAGLAAGAALSGSASGQSAAGQVGTPSSPEDMYAALLNVSDTGSDPGSNGEWRRNGSDVKVYSGGGVRNLTDIGSGGGGGSLSGDLIGDWGHHTQYADGLTNEEVTRISLNAGDALEVHRLEASLKGGGTNADVGVDIYDETNGIVLASTTGGGETTGEPIATSGAGATVLIRVSTPSSTPAFAINGDTRVV